MTDTSTLSAAPQTKETVQALWRLEKIILNTLDFTEVVQKIVDSVLTELGYLQLGYRIIVLALVDHQTQQLKRVSISQTDEARRALQILPIPFNEIVIPNSEKDNLCIRAMMENKPYITHDWYEILHPSFTADEARQVQQAVGINTSMVYPVFYNGRADGVMIFSMVKDENQVSESERDLIKSFTDIVGLAVQNAKLYTDLDMNRRELKAANEKLKQLDKLKDEFVSIASHELRTPLTAIKGYLWMAINKSPTPLPDEVQKNLQVAHDASERLSVLVEDMLTTSRIESGRIKLEFSPYDIVKLANDVVMELKVRADEKKINLSVQSAIPTLNITGDKARIQEVFINLVGNALKFTPDGGSITLLISQQGDTVDIGVKDTGPGLSQEDISKLFQKFSKLESSYAHTKETGTGLGLYISKQIVLLHQGNITISSEVGKGTTFTVHLPLVSHLPENTQENAQVQNQAVVQTQVQSPAQPQNHA
jgi:signal transduction histidine kinase